MGRALSFEEARALHPLSSDVGLAGPAPSLSERSLNGGMLVAACSDSSAVDQYRYIFGETERRAYQNIM